MKKWFALPLAAVLCLSVTNLLLAAALCLSPASRDGKKGENTVASRETSATAASSDAPANIGVDVKEISATAARSDAPANIVVDGKEISAKDFLIEHLNAYIQSDACLARKATFEKRLDWKAPPLAVTDAFELKSDNWGSEHLSLHFFMVKAKCASFVDGIAYDSVTMAIDYDTGTFYDRYSVDESWMKKSEKEKAIYIAVAGGCFVDTFYYDEPILEDSEIHIPLSYIDIAEVNQALNK